VYARVFSVAFALGCQLGRGRPMLASENWGPITAVTQYPRIPHHCKLRACICKSVKRYLLSVQNRIAQCTAAHDTINK